MNTSVAQGVKPWAICFIDSTNKFLSLPVTSLPQKASYGQNKVKLFKTIRIWVQVLPF